MQVVIGIGGGSAKASPPSLSLLHHCWHFQKAHAPQMTLNATLMHSWLQLVPWRQISDSQEWQGSVWGRPLRWCPVQWPFSLESPL